MANFSFVSSASYRPYSYEQWLAPMMAYKQEYDAVQEALDEQAMQGAAVKDIIMRDPTSPEAIAYQNYSDNVKQQADILSTQGLKGADRTAVSKIRRNYAENIAPIEQAANEYKDLIKQQQQSRAKGLYVSNMPTFSNYRLTGQGFTTASPDDFYKAGQQAASAYGSQFSTAELEHFDRYLNRITQTTGVSPDVALAELGNENSSLSRAFADYMKSQGMGENSNYSPEDIAAAAAQYTSGIYAGSQQKTSTKFEDRKDNPIAIENLALTRAQKEQQIENNKILGAQRRFNMVAQFGPFDPETRNYIKTIDFNGQKYNVGLNEDTGGLTITNSNGEVVTDKNTLSEVQRQWATTTGKPSSSSSKTVTSFDKNGNKVEQLNKDQWIIVESGNPDMINRVIPTSEVILNDEEYVPIVTKKDDKNKYATSVNENLAELNYDVDAYNEKYGKGLFGNKNNMYLKKVTTFVGDEKKTIESAFGKNYDTSKFDYYISDDGYAIAIPKTQPSTPTVSNITNDSIPSGGTRSYKGGFLKEIK